MINHEKRKHKRISEVDCQSEYRQGQIIRSKIENLEHQGFLMDVFPDVYFPHEDSLLLADFAKRLAFGKVLDLGCGCGIAGLCASSNSKVSEITFADISKSAISNARHNSTINLIFENQSIEKLLFIQSDLFKSFSAKKFDTILFNPPYLPTSDEEKLSGPINDAFDGGKDGRRVIDKFLPEFEKHLLPDGILLYLDSSLTGSEKTHKYLESQNLTHEKIASQKFFFEELSVFRIARR